MLTSFLALRAESNQWDEHGDRQNSYSKDKQWRTPDRDSTLVGKLTTDCDCKIKILFDSFYNILLKYDSRNATRVDLEQYS